MNDEDLKVIDLNTEEAQPEENTVNKKTYNKKSLFLVVVGVICIVIALCGLYNVYREYKDAKDIYDKAEEEFVQVLVPNSEDAEHAGQDTTTEEATDSAPEPEWYERVSVDLTGLQSKYDEVVGWLYFENETINYPLMQGDDNEKYLRTAYDGTYANAGSIFVEATHSGDFSDIHTIVYGHNQRDANMFGKLMKYYKYTWYYSGRQYFQIFSGDKIYRYRVFAYQVVTLDSFVFREAPVSASTWANKLLENSMIDKGIPVEDNDRIVTLCTCTDDRKDRFLVSAVLVETYDRTTKTVTQN